MRQAGGIPVAAGFPQQSRTCSSWATSSVAASRPSDLQSHPDSTPHAPSQLTAILKICVPSATSPEALVLYLHAFFLILRTYLSLVVANLDGRIVRDLIRGDAKEFGKGIGWWFAVAIPATYTNSMVGTGAQREAKAQRSFLCAQARFSFFARREAFFLRAAKLSLVDRTNARIPLSVERANSPLGGTRGSFPSTRPG